MLKSATKFAVLGVIASLVAPLAGAASPKTATIDVSMRIVADCTVTANALDFGQNQGLLNAAVTANTSLGVTCTNTTPYNVGLNQGTGAGSSGTTRYMAGTGANANTVKFNLMQSAGGALWGNTAGSDTVSGIGNGTAQPLTVYGEIPIQNSPAPDTYKSTVTATVYF